MCWCGRVPCVRLGAYLLGLVVGVFACGWLGFGVCVAVVFVWVFACFGVGVLVGWWGGMVSLLPVLLVCLFACLFVLWCGLVGVCATVLAPPACAG